LRVNGLQASAYTPLLLDLHEVARKGVLTGEVVEAAATDDVDGGNGVEVEEGAPSLAPRYTQAPRTLGKAFPATRTTDGGAHWW
jgi:hypothetical protein